VVFKGLYTRLIQSGSDIVSDSGLKLQAGAHQSDIISFSCADTSCRSGQTTPDPEYCTPKAENLKYLNYKNIPNHVSNNCLVLTYK